MIRTVDAGEAAAHRAAGARLVRHAHDMALDLTSLRPASDWMDPALPRDLRLEPVIRPASELAAAATAAYVPGHPDAGPSPDEVEDRLRQVLSGQVTGPLLPQASAAIVETGSGSVAAAVLVTRLGATSWWPGGPWVAEIFVVPARQGHGLGRTLLLRSAAVCHAAGAGRMGLSVTDGNPAERLYAGVGFRRVRTVFVLDAR